MKHQQGTALITVLLIVALVTGLATSLASEFQLTLAKAEHRVFGAQIKQYIFSAESFAQWVLQEDAKKNEEDDGVVFDHLGEPWATANFASGIDNGWIELGLIDAQSLFNLNQLAGRPEPYQPFGTFAQQFTPPQQQFVRLLQTNEALGISSTDARAITEAVIDWIDADDSVTGAGGAESGFYAGKRPAYRPANQPFTHASELRLIKGITPELYRYLRPLVITLPSSQGMNVNTANATLMRTINLATEDTPLSEEAGENLINDRAQAAESDSNTSNIDSEDEGEYYKNLGEFINSNAMTAQFDTQQLQTLPRNGLSTQSDYFLLSTRTQLVNQQQFRSSLLKRSREGDRFRVSVISRSQRPL